MISDANGLIEHLENRFRAMVHGICCLEKSCVKVKRCDANNRIPLLDFDKVKDLFCKGGAKWASVDGLLEQQGILCFVELKSWENFLKYQFPEKEEDIQGKLDSYNLEDKLTGSMLICQEEAENPNLFRQIPIVFILVTDIDTEKKGEWSILQNLMMLSHSTSNWESVCNRLTMERLSTMEVNTIYCSCCDFDRRLLEGVSYLHCGTSL